MVSSLVLRTGDAAKFLLIRTRRLRKGSDIDHTIDRWIRLMEDSEKISSLDRDNFIMVKKYLEDKLSLLRGREGKSRAEIPPANPQS